MIKKALNNITSKLLSTAVLTCLMTGCAKYSVAVNERTVYTPPPVFTAFNTEDPELQRCIDATIKEGRLTQPEQLQRLFCPDYQIKSLVGLQTFKWLTVLDVANNEITDIGVLASLKKLKKVNLTNNRVSTLTPVTRLDKLEQVIIKGNPQVQCSDIMALRTENRINIESDCTH